MKSATRIHGKSLSYVTLGDGPVLLLIHGFAGDWNSWRPLIRPLARSHTVVVPELPGHGDSERLDDCSLGALASLLRDLLVLLGQEQATIVGHSLGGGIAMQFAYQFPEFTQRLVLVSSGGLGREVGGLLRAAALPGAGPFIATTAWLGAWAAGLRLFAGDAHRSLARRPDVVEIVRGYLSLRDRQRRRAFLSLLRAMVGTRGQRIAATSRLYLAEAMPVLIVCGERDTLIPPRHAEEAHRAIRGSQLELFEAVRHFPQLEAPDRLLGSLESFLLQTTPARLTAADLGPLVRAQAEAQVQQRKD